MKRRAAISGLEKPSRANRDLRLLGGEVLLGLYDTFADKAAGGLQLPLGAPRERLETHPRAHLVRGAQLLARV